MGSFGERLGVRDRGVGWVGAGSGLRERNEPRLCDLRTIQPARLCRSVSPQGCSDDRAVAQGTLRSRRDDRARGGGWPEHVQSRGIALAEDARRSSTERHQAVPLGVVRPRPDACVAPRCRAPARDEHRPFGAPVGARSVPPEHGRDAEVLATTGNPGRLSLGARRHRQGRSGGARRGVRQVQGTGRAPLHPRKGGRRRRGKRALRTRRVVEGRAGVDGHGPRPCGANPRAAEPAGDLSWNLFNGPNGAPRPIIGVSRPRPRLAARRFGDLPVGSPRRDF